MAARPGSITAANAAFAITIPGVFSAPQLLQQYSADDIFDNEQMKPAEVQMGVDGVLATGFVYVPMVQRVTFMANSPSVDIFDQWWTFQQTLQDIYQALATITLNSIGKKWSLINGSLTGYNPMPSAGRVLKPRQFEITWEKVIPQPN